MLFARIYRLSYNEIYLFEPTLYLILVIQLVQRYAIDRLSSTCADVETGKRQNVLRNRLDSWDYDIDELFLGTILFTLVVFLFPTFAAYYFFLALVS